MRESSRLSGWYSSMCGQEIGKEIIKSRSAFVVLGNV